MSHNMQAQRVGSSARRPRTYNEGRVCGSKGCKTVISRYNRSDFCFTHAPPTFPRLRGVVTEA